MKRCVLAAIAALLFMTAHSQTEIKIDELNQHIGDSVTICTKIFGGIHLEKSKITLLNAGGDYPNAPLTLVIWDESRAKFKEAPETFYKDKNICVSGKLALYREKPQIVVYDEKQILLKEK